MRQYGSFVVRWWRAGLEVQRLHIRHVQSDQEVAAESLLEARAWMAARLTDDGRAPPQGWDEADGLPLPPSESDESG
ncbi:MAG TPA: hypothetical protein VIL85_15280 [Thermomicrobiales bacterium]|jgi:hypothetical protein